MKVLQLIDSLDAGGAERVAVNYANMLSSKFGEAYLTTTRKSGVLESDLSAAVVYKNLNRSSTFDFKAIKVFKNHIRKHEIQVVHAHTTSYFFAALVKLTSPELKIIWHDHQGNRDEINFFKQLPLIVSSLFFDGVICVNESIKSWATKYLFCKKVIYIENFVSSNSKSSDVTQLSGVEGKRIISLANLKHPKNHLQLLQAFHKVHKLHPDWTLNLVGMDYKDDYSEELKKFIEENNLKNSVFRLGLKSDISHILKQCSIGVIASTFEGLPMALLEYGNASLAVVSTDVGNCKDLVENRGIVVEKGNLSQLETGLLKLIENDILRTDYSKKLKNFVDKNFSETAISTKIIRFYNSI